jgi:hypothetical protein
MLEAIEHNQIRIIMFSIQSRICQGYANGSVGYRLRFSQKEPDILLQVVLFSV